MISNEYNSKAWRKHAHGLNEDDKKVNFTIKLMKFYPVISILWVISSVKNYLEYVGPYDGFNTTDTCVKDAH